MTGTEREPKVNQWRSRQSGHPSGLLGRVVGRLMVASTGPDNTRSIELLELPPQSTVLEVGYGQGEAVRHLVAAGHTVIGVDVSETMRRQARGRNRAACRAGRADLRRSDGRTLPFDYAIADAAMTTHTIYFMPEPATTLSEIHRVLKPGGRLVIACHVGDDPMPAWMDPAVYRIPRKADIDRLLEEVGYVVESHTVGTDDYPTWWFVARRSA